MNQNNDETQIKQEILNDILYIYQKNGFINREIYECEGNFKLKEIKTHFKSFKYALMECSKENIIDINFERELPLIGNKHFSHSEETKAKLAKKQYECQKRKSNKIYDFTKEETKEKAYEFFNKEGEITKEKFLKYTNFHKPTFMKMFNNSFICFLKEIGLYDKQKIINDKKKSNAGKIRPSQIKDFDDEFCKNEALRILKEEGTVTSKLFFQKTKIHKKTFLEKYGSFRNFLKKIDLYNTTMKIKMVNHPKTSHITKEEIANKIIDFYEKNNKQKFTANEFYGKTGISQHIVTKLFGSFSKAVQELGLFKGNRIEKTKEEIIEHMWKLYYANGEKLNTTIQRKDGYITQTNVENMFGSFSNMLMEMGLKPNYASSVSDEELLAELQELANKFGTINTVILEKETKYSRPTYLHRFGNIKGICDKLNIVNVATNGNSVSDIGLYCIYLFEQELKIIAQTEKTFTWLKNPKTSCNLYLDGYFEKYNLAIEYDGEQHFKEVSFYNKEENSLLNLQEKDKLKDKLCKEHNITLIRVRYDEDLTPELVKNKLKEYNIIY
jgi:hypothetical protein